MRIDFFFFESEGGGTEFHPIKYMCIMKQKKKKKRKKKKEKKIELNNLGEEKRTYSVCVGILNVLFSCKYLYIFFQLILLLRDSIVSS